MALDTVRIDYTNQLRTGSQSYSDGQNLQMRGTNEGAVVIQEHGGRYQEQARRGQLFIYTTTTAAAFLLSATTGNVPTIWNKAGSGKICYITRVRVSFLSGTTTIGSLVWAQTANAGSAIGTAAPVVTFTNVAPVPAIIGAPFTSAMSFAPAVCTFTAAPVVVAATTINFGAASPTAGSPNDIDAEAGIAIYPGNALSLCYTVTTSTALWFASIYAYEVGMVAGQ